MLWSIFVLAALPTAVPAGEIFGDLRMGAKYVSNAELRLKCGTETASAKTDSTGSFRLTVKGGGKCQLSVVREKLTPTIDVVVFDKPAQYHLLLEEKDGKFVLRRV